ncbi:MAG: hypothetical protein HYV65_01680 [Candidatus Spechtbacteria bacterium]|nr:hypothetical protein [Candidatus Spechtbacteria bacterium]
MNPFFNGLLGINARNLLFIQRSTSPYTRVLIDNKLKTKEILEKNNIPTPKTFAVIRSADEALNFNWSSLPLSFALKPNKGFGGAGIVVAYGECKKNHSRAVGSPHIPTRTWIGLRRTHLDTNFLSKHIIDILDGKYSINGTQDTAYFEERIKLLKEFRIFTSKGMPDIRVVVYNSIPVMAELRLPTTESDGRANLHLGGVGVGIDISTGKTTFAIHHDKPITFHPDNLRIPLAGLAIPYWEEILELAIASQQAIGSNFLGVDISIDKYRGPMILECNARPGLAIQLANRAPLYSRLQRVEGLKIHSIKQGVQIAKNIFCDDNSHEQEGLQRTDIIGIRENISIITPNGITHPTVAKIDTGAYRTTLDVKIAEQLNLTGIKKYKHVRGVLGKENRPIIDLVFELRNKKISTEAFVADREEMKHDIIIGRRDLKRFLVDPAKNVRIPYSE